MVATRVCSSLKIYEDDVDDAIDDDNDEEIHEENDADERDESDVDDASDDNKHDDFKVIATCICLSLKL